MADNFGEGVVMISLKKNNNENVTTGASVQRKTDFLGGCQETAELILKADVPLVARMWLSPGMRTCSE